MSSNKYQNALDMINLNINPDIAQKGSIGSFRAGKNDIYGKCLEAFNKNVEPDITAHEHITSRLYENAYIENTWPVTLEDSSIDILGDKAFNNCTSLTSVNFPACTSIGRNAFYGCESLTSVNFPACTNISRSAFYGCKSLTDISFPACTSIGEFAFNDCTSLTSVNFPACTSIGEFAFFNCVSLTSLYFTGSSVPSTNDNSFVLVPSTATFYVASSMVDAFKSASYWSAFASQIVAYTE